MNHHNARKNLQKAMIMGGIFIAALIVYFIYSFTSMEKENTVYTSLSEPTLPVAYTEMFGMRMNPMHAYIQDMGNEAAMDSITVLPEDRQLPLIIKEYNNMVISVSYEVRTLDLAQLIERTEITEFSRENGEARAVLPIQNMLEKDVPYLLSVTVDTGEKSLHYYTRIIWSSHNYAEDMIRMAKNFTESTFDPERARDLASYLESNTNADNTSYGNVNIYSSYSMVTWGNLGMQPCSELDVTLKEYSGVMAEVQVDYQTQRIGENQTEELYDNEDNFTLRWDPQRIFLMDYERTTDEVFTGEKSAFSGQKVMLGITNPDRIETKPSDSGQFTAFKTNRDLWRYDRDNNMGIKIFSFRSEEKEKTRKDCKDHDIKILSCRNNGDINFIVYGYMNRGRHEGYNGIVFYTYDNSEDTIREEFFIPLAKTYEKIADDVGKMSYLSAKEMFYFIQNSTLYGIDINSRETMTVTTGLQEGAYAVSGTQNQIAWQNGGAYDSEKINFLNLDTDVSKTIEEEGDYVRVFGFIGNDLVYGTAGKDDLWYFHNRVTDLPVHVLNIMSGENGSVLNSYNQEGVYLAGIDVQKKRVQMDTLAKIGENTYQKTGDDTIVSTEAQMEDGAVGVEEKGDKKKVFYVKLNADVSRLNQKQPIRIRAPKVLSYENTSNVELPVTEKKEEALMFNAYVRGHYLGLYQSLSDAVERMNGAAGYVTDQYQRPIWNRMDKPTTAKVKNADKEISEMTEALADFSGSGVYEDIVLVDCLNMRLNEVLSFVAQGHPVLAYHQDGGYEFIVGYDQFNVTLKSNGEERIMGKKDAEAYFDTQGNDFIAMIPKQLKD